LESQQQAPLTFTQQLQRQSKLSSRNNLMVNSKHASSSGAAGHKSSGGGGGGGAQRHSQVLPDLSEHQLGRCNIILTLQLKANQMVSKQHPT